VCRLRGARQYSHDDYRACEQTGRDGSSRFHGSPLIICLELTRGYLPE
jgi:hypothetical protein